jgi:hypothetical protein
MSRPVPTVRVLSTDHPSLTWEIDCSACGFVATGHPFERFQANRLASEHREQHRHRRHDTWACCLVLLVGAAVLIGLLFLAAYYRARP